MDKVKDPAFILSTGNTVALIGVTVYFYKQIATIQNEISKLDEHVGNIAVKVAEQEKMTQQTPQIVASIQNLHAATTKCNNAIKSLTENLKVELEDVDTFIDGITESLQNSGIMVDSRTPKPRTDNRDRGRRRVAIPMEEVKDDDDVTQTINNLRSKKQTK